MARAVLVAAGLAGSGPTLAGLALAAGTQAAQAQTAAQSRQSPSAQTRPSARPTPKPTPQPRREAPTTRSRPSPLRPDPTPDPRPDPYPKPQPARPMTQAPRVAPPPSDPTPVVLQPSQRAWGPGGPVAAGAALGSLQPGLATAVAGPAPANGMCWYYKTPDQRVGFWDKCTP